MAAYTMPEERKYAVNIEPIETDSFGRVLFRYNSLYTWSDEMVFDFIPDEPNAKSNKVSAYLILQKSDGQNACDPNLVKVDFGTTDKDAGGHLLWSIMIQDKKEPQNTVSYFAITDESGYASDENSFLKVSSLDYINDLKQLKIRNHWAFMNQR